MRTWTTTLALAALLVAGAAAQQDAVPRELAALQGTWNIVSVNGQSPADQGVALSVTFTGNKYTQSLNGQVVESGTIKLDATRKPMAADFAILEGDDAGKLQLGIVDIAEDTVTFALATPGTTERPMAFSSTGAAGVFVLKKVQ
jgi:uncharacterized protein (TIGR03067 family)